MKYQINERLNVKKIKINYLQNDRYIHFKELVRSYIELENRLKHWRKKQTIMSSERNDSEAVKLFINENSPKDRNRTKSLAKQMFTILITFGV